MFPFDDRSILSPDGSREALLRPAGKSPWKLTRTRLHLAGLTLSERSFDWQGVWSDCSRYFAIMEWSDEALLRIPEARLVLIDLWEAKECTIDHVKSGFVEPLRVYDGKVRYARIDLTKRSKEILERPIAGTAVWTGVSEGSPATWSSAGSVRSVREEREMEEP